MRNRADIYRQKAHECERAANRVADPQVSTTMLSKSIVLSKSSRSEATSATPTISVTSTLWSIGTANQCRLKNTDSDLRHCASKPRRSTNYSATLTIGMSRTISENAFAIDARIYRFIPRVI